MKTMANTKELCVRGVMALLFLMAVNAFSGGYHAPRNVKVVKMSAFPIPFTQKIEVQAKPLVKQVACVEAPVKDKPEKLFSTLVWHIKTHEGYRSRAYTCAAGKKTIGFGHVLREGEDFSTCDESLATEWLYQDLNRKLDKVNKILPDTFKRRHHLATASLFFRCNTKNFKKTNLYKYMVQYVGNPNENNKILLKRKWMEWCNYKTPYMKGYPRIGKYDKIVARRKKDGLTSYTIRSDKMKKRGLFEFNLFVDGQTYTDKVREDVRTAWVQKRQKYTSKKS